MKDLSLNGKKIRLIPFQKDFFKEIYKWYINLELTDFFVDCDKQMTSKQFYDYLVDMNNHILLFIVPNDKDIPVGCIYDYNYNKLDGYTYAKFFIKKDYDESIIEACNMFYNYLFTFFPIRKIYYEEYEYNKDKIKPLKKLKFRLECCLKKYKFYIDGYHDKYIFALFKKDFYKGGEFNG